MGFLDNAGLQYLWGKLKEKFAPKSHSHDDRYYTESEMDGKLNSKVNNTKDGASSLINKLDSATGIPVDSAFFVSQYSDGTQSAYYRRPVSTLWTYIKGKADGIYQPKGSYASSGHTHSFSSITDKPSTYTPSAHNQSWSTITDKPALMESGDYSAETIEALLKQVQWLSPRMGSCRLTKDTHVANTWWNFIYTPHRTGSGGDNPEYGTLLLFPMVGAGSSYIVRAGKDGIVREVRKIYTSGDKPTKVDVGLGNVDNTADANKSVKYATSAGSANTATKATTAGTADKLGTSAGTATQPVYFKDGKPVVIGYTIAKSVPADAKFTDTNTWRGIQNNLTSDSKDQSLSAAQGKALKTLVDGKAAAGHTHNSVKDAGNNSSNTTFAYSKSGMNYGDYNWLAGWNGYELRAINKNQFATAGHNHDSRYYTESEIDSKLDGKSNVGHTHDYLPTAGGTMNGTITLSDSSHGKIYSGPTDNVNGPGGDLNNIVIESWNGLSFTTGCPNQTYTGKTAIGIDCREGVVKAARFDGTLNGTAARLGRGDDPNASMTFNWSGKDGQPTWLWGGEDGTNMYVYNPGNFKVNWAQSAANGVYTNGFNGSGGYIRFCNGVQICWGRTNCSGKDTTINFSAAFSDSSYSVSTMPFYSSLADTYWNVKEGSMGTTSFVLHGSKSSIDLRTILWIAIGKWN